MRIRPAGAVFKRWRPMGVIRWGAVWWSAAVLRRETSGRQPGPKEWLQIGGLPGSGFYQVFLLSVFKEENSFIFFTELIFVLGWTDTFIPFKNSGKIGDIIESH